MELLRAATQSAPPSRRAAALPRRRAELRGRGAHRKPDGVHEARGAAGRQAPCERCGEQRGVRGLVAHVRGHDERKLLRRAEQCAAVRAPVRIPCQLGEVGRPAQPRALSWPRAAREAQQASWGTAGPRAGADGAPGCAALTVWSPGAPGPPQPPS